MQVSAPQRGNMGNRAGSVGERRATHSCFPGGTGALFISLKKPAMVHNPSVNSLADAGADSEGGEPLLLSFTEV
jgi:hypothetical protein